MVISLEEAIEQKLELVHGVGFPLLQIVDFLLHKAVFLGHVRVHRMILASNESLLFLQNGIFARQSEQIQIKDRVLLRQFN